MNEIEKMLLESIKENTGFSSVSFSDEDGSNKTTYSLNTQAEQEAVDPGVQEALLQNARWHRREARRLLGGRSGLTKTEQVERINQAIAELQCARDLLNAEIEAEEA